MEIWSRFQHFMWIFLCCCLDQVVVDQFCQIPWHCFLTEKNCDGHPRFSERHVAHGLSIAAVLQLVRHTYSHWPSQEPKLEVPTIYKAYVRPM